MNDLIINIDGPRNYIIDDTIILNGTINTDLTNYKIRCSIKDASDNEVKLATSNSGGADSEINVTDATNGTIIITCAKDLTASFDKISYITIEVENASGQVKTLMMEQIIFDNDRLTWTDSSA